MNPEFFDYLKDGGVIGLLLFFVYGGMKEWWVFGTHFRSLRTESEARLTELRDDRDYWRSIAEELLNISREGVRLAERRHRPVVED
jgi:hypothetical protein